jgi:hypothetical protein
VKLRLDDPFSGMFAAPNVLAIVGGAITVSDAFEVLPVPPLVEATVTELFFTPADAPVTFTENVQLVAVAKLAPDRLALADPAVAVIDPPPHEPLNPFGVEITNPAGKLSVKLIPVNVAFAAGLLIVKDNAVDPLSGIVAAPNDLEIAGGCRLTVTVAVAVVPVPPSVEDTAEVVFT